MAGVLPGYSGIVGQCALRPGIHCRCRAVQTPWRHVLWRSGANSVAAERACAAKMVVDQLQVCPSNSSSMMLPAVDGVDSAASQFADRQSSGDLDRACLNSGCGTRSRRRIPALRRKRRAFAPLIEWMTANASSFRTSGQEATQLGQDLGSAACRSQGRLGHGPIISGQF